MTKNSNPQPEPGVTSAHNKGPDRVDPQIGPRETEVNEYERRELTPRVNPLTLVRPEYGLNWDEDMLAWDTRTSPLMDKLLGLGFDSREVDVLRDEDTDEELAAVMLIQKLGFEAAREIQREIPAVNKGPVFEDVVGRMDADPKMLALQRKYAFIKDWGGKVRVAWRDSTGAFRTRSLPSFRESLLGQYIDLPTDKGTVRKGLADAWLNWARKRSYNEARFLPGQRPYPGTGILNLWDGWPVQMSRGKATYMCHHILEYMCDGDQETYNWVMGWLAHAVQRVHETPTTALVLAGPQGSGKNIFVKLLFELFGANTMMCTQSAQLVGNFNSHLMDKLFVFANEAFFAGNKKEANALKSLVTDQTMVVEPKGVDAFQVKKHFRLILASNEERVVNLEIDDRRFCVLNADARDCNNNREYFGELIELWREKGEREMFLRELAEWDLSTWDEGAIPETAARVCQRELSLPPGAREAYDLLAEGGGEALVAWDSDAGQVAIKPGPEWSKTTGKFMREAGGARTVLKGHGRVWILPDLGTARREFAQALRIREDWDQPDHLWWDQGLAEERRLSGLTTD